MSSFLTNMHTLEEKAAGKRSGGAWHGEPDDCIGSLLRRTQTSTHHLMELRHRLGNRWAQPDPDITSHEFDREACNKVLSNGFIKSAYAACYWIENSAI